MQAPLNQLTLFIANILGYIIFIIFEVSETIFFLNQKRRLIIIWYLKLNASLASFTWFCSLEWWVAHKLCWCYWETLLEQCLDSESLVLNMVCILRPVVSQNNCQQIYFLLSHLGLMPFTHRETGRWCVLYNFFF